MGLAAEEMEEVEAPLATGAATAAGGEGKGPRFEGRQAQGSAARGGTRAAPRLPTPLPAGRSSIDRAVRRSGGDQAAQKLTGSNLHRTLLQRRLLLLLHRAGRPSAGTDGHGLGEGQGGRGHARGALSSLHS